MNCFLSQNYALMWKNLSQLDHVSICGVVEIMTYCVTTKVTVVLCITIVINLTISEIPA